MQVIWTTAAEVSLVFGIGFLVIAIVYFFKYHIASTIVALTDPNGTRRSQKAMRKRKKAQQRKDGIAKKSPDKQAKKESKQSKKAHTEELSAGAKEERTTTVLHQDAASNHDVATDDAYQTAILQKKKPKKAQAVLSDEVAEAKEDSKFVILRKTIRTVDRRED